MLPSQRIRPSRRAVRVALAGAAACAALFAATAYAADSVETRIVHVEIAPNDLGAALIEFSSQTDIQLVMVTDEVSGIASPGLSGECSVADALNRLLAGTGLTYNLDASGTIAVMRAPVSKAESGDATSSARPAAPERQAAGHNVQLEEVIVTAQKREQRLQDVPLAVTALGGDALADQHINDTNGLVQAVPSLTYQQGNNPTNTTFRLRGVGTSLFAQGVEASVSVVVDGVVAARQAQSFADFADIERIEVLRGPQGTLFGKNATAGVIHAVTARPSRELEGKAEVSVAQQDEYRVRGTISGPLSETVRVRATGYYNDVGGNLRNAVTGSDYGGNEGHGGRLKIEWDASDDLNLLLSGDYRKSEAECCRPVLIHTENPSLAQLYAPVVASLDNESIVDNVSSGFENEQLTVSLQGELALDRHTFTSISAYQNFKVDNNIDADGIFTPVPLFVGTGAGANAQFDLNAGQLDLGQLSQELRVASDAADRLTYVAGLYYSHLSLDRDFQRRRALCASGTLGMPCGAPAFQSAQHTATLESQHIALFGQGEYEIVDGLKALLGLRAQYEDVEVAGTRTGIPLVPGDTIFPGHGANTGKRSADDSAVTGKIGLQYELSRNAQFYGTYTRGYKGLGFDTEITANFATQEPVQPETVNAYELGFKGQSDNGLFSVAIAAFLADYQDLQVQANRSDPTTGVINLVQTNAGSSRTQGVEFEATLRPSDSLTLGLAVTYVDTSIDINGLNCPLQDQAAAPILTGNFPVNSCYRSRLPNASGVLVTSGPIQDVRDGSLPVAPQWRINLGPRYERELGSSGLVGFAQLNATYQSKQHFAVEQDPLLVQDAYTIVDASIGMRDIDDRYSVALFAKNLFDERYFTTVSHGGTLAGPASPFDLYANVPKDSSRYFGATLRVSF